MTSKKMKNKKNIDQSPVKHKKKKEKRWIKPLIALIVILTVIGFAFIFGFIPVGLNVKPPIGNVETLNADAYLDEFPELANMPNLDKIEYGAFGTDASTEEVAVDYKNTLLSEGYNQEYSGTVEVDGVNFEADGYLKGLTAVGILTTDETTENYDYNSLVLYATGNALDFREILDWYQTN